MVNKWFTILILAFAAYSFITKPSTQVLTQKEKEETSEYIDKMKDYVDMLTHNPNDDSLRDKNKPLLHTNIESEDVTKDSIPQEKLISQSKVNIPKDDMGFIQEKMVNFTYNVLQSKPGKDFLEKVLLSNEINPDGKQNNQYVNHSILDVIEGDGEKKANCGDLVEVHYVTRLVDGQEIENTRINKNPIVFQIGDGKVIKGIEYAIIGMKEGGIRRLIVPPKFAYRDKRFSKDMISGNEFVTLDVELIKLNSSSVKEKNNIRVFDEAKGNYVPMLCSNEVYFTYKLLDANEKLIHSSFEKVHFRLGSSEVPDAINEAFLDIKPNSKRVIIMPGSLIYNKKISFLPGKISLPPKGMLILEVYTFGRSE